MSPLLTVTFVRHGESVDNLRNVWAGWKDSALSNHGMNQARACGESFSAIHFSAIHASPLKRAFTTAQAIHDAQPHPKPSLTTSPNLREQGFGIAEGKPWMINQRPDLSLEEHFAQDLFPILHHRDQKFPEGESLNDLHKRAAIAVDECIIPHVWDAIRDRFKGGHIALVSHGLCISAMIPALLKKDPSNGEPGDQYRGLMNTAWTRVSIDVKGWDDDSQGPPPFSEDNLPPLVVRVVAHNRHEHLDNIRRQKGGIGSSPYDPKQKDIRAFFSGANVATEAIPTPLAEAGQSASNAHDEVGVAIH